jgi:acyl transferase domain-containing protein/NADP-dependent 3-hydroxy acid dehydrogenase YdfG
VRLFEAHGTGTVAGDTAELETTTRLLRAVGGPPRGAVVGSVKTTIGHTKAAAGIAGFIKVAMALESKVLPPHANVVKPNATLSAEDCPLYLVRHAQPWVASAGHPRRASVSAFGFGGTNFHIALEEYRDAYLTAAARAPRDTWTHELFLWNRSDDLSVELRALHDALAQGARPRPRDLAYSLCLRWDGNRPSLAIVASDLESLQQRLSATLALLDGSGGPSTGVYLADEPLAIGGKVAALFPGQGSQYPDMLRELAVVFPEIVEPLVEADAIFLETAAERPQGPDRLSSAIYPPGRFSAEDEDQARHTLTRTEVAQPALGAIAAGLWNFMTGRLGLRADMTAGHSYGEYLALYAAGVFGFTDLIRLSEARGRFIVQAAQGSDLGAMAAVQAGREDVERIASEYSDVQVANHNAPGQSILAGGSQTIEAVVAKLAAAGYIASRLPVAAAFHSPFVAPASDALSEFMNGIEFAMPAVPVFSNTTAAQHSEDPAGIRSNLVAQLAKPVEFVAEIKAMYEAGARVFVEIGPKGVLSRLVDLILEGQPHVSVAIDGADGGISGFLDAVGIVTAHGVALNLGTLFAGRDCRVLPLDDLVSTTREQPIPSHAWIINGSGVRRVSDPPRVVGITLDQVDTASSNISPPEIHPRVQDSGASPPASRASAQIPTGAKRSAMTEVYYPESSDDRHGVLESYFETMRQFLVSQEAVMSAYLGAAPVSGRRGIPTRSLVGAMPSRPALAQPALKPPPPPAPQPRLAPQPAPAPQAASPAPAQPTPSQVSAAAEPMAPPSAPPAAAAKGNGSDMTRDALVEQLLHIVENRTGYPKDMIGMDQNMEADLGIDSIKRVEIAGALLKSLPQWVVEQIGTERDKINTQKTLSGIVDLIAAKALSKGGNARPFDLAGAGISRQTNAALPRFVMREESQPIDGIELEPIAEGPFAITEDSMGVAPRVASLLENAGAKTLVIPAAVLDDPAALEEQVAGLTGVVGLIHLAPLGEVPLPWDQEIEAFRARVERNEKSLFRLTHLWSEPLSQGTLIAASGLGGTFGRDGSSGGLYVQGGAVGLIKSAREEWPLARVKAIDLDPEQPPESLAKQIVQEIRLAGGRLEVGYPSGVRTVFHTERAPVGGAPLLVPSPDWVVLAIGGARGITAEVLGGLAVTGLTLVLTGRTPLPPPEPAELSALADENQLRRHFIAKAKGEGALATPASVERQVAAVLRDREILANVRELERAGSRVIYRVVDVRDPQGMEALFDEIYGQFGRLDGVVHGAGIIEDKRIADKTPESWSRVVGTKIDGLFLIARHVRSETLRFLVVFGSVAGRYGNSGQGDYATANELLNRLACQLHFRWGASTKVAVLNWGPWAATRHGKGMVTPQTEQKFAEKGIALVSPDLGRRLFVEELTLGAPEQIEIVAGEGPWDQWEDQVGALKVTPAAQAQALLPLLRGTRTETGSKGEQILFHTFDERQDLFLAHHRIDGVSVVPAAVALELMAEAASRLWPGWHVNSVSDLRVLKGLSLDSGGRLTVAIAGLTSAHGDATGFDVTMEIRSVQDPLVRHYRGVVHLATTPLESSRFESVLKASTSPVTSAQAYDQFLFHGPRFQVISRISGLDQRGALTTVEPTQPTDWVAGASASASWFFDPGLVDSGPQMSIVWSCVMRNELALPNRIGRVTRFRRALPAQLKMHYLVYPESAEHCITADVAFVDPEGYLILMMEEVEGTGSAGLNRLRGQWTAAIAQ